MMNFSEEEVRRYARRNEDYGQLGSEGAVYKFEDYAVKLFKKVNALSALPKVVFKNPSL
jgi:hypothetical protein